MHSKFNAQNIKIKSIRLEPNNFWSTFSIFDLDRYVEFFGDLSITGSKVTSKQKTILNITQLPTVIVGMRPADRHRVKPNLSWFGRRFIEEKGLAFNLKEDVTKFE